MRGYVIINVSGFSPERFINLCANKGIYVWHVTHTNNGFNLCMSAKGFMTIRPLVKKTGCKVRITKKIGLPFRFFIFRKRRIFLFGIIICMAIVFFLSLFIWKVDFEGNTMYTDSQLTRFLKEQSHYVGMWKKDVRCSELEKILLKEYGYMNWVTCEMKGTRLVVRIEEGRFNTPIEDLSKPCDIVADKKGIVMSIVTRTGTPHVVKGDVVEKGDVLVSGTLEIKELEEIKAIEFAHADADIFIKTVYEYHDELDYKYFEKVYTDREKQDLTIHLLNYKINLFKPRIKYRDYDKIYTSKEVCLFDNFYLPVRFDTASYKEYNVIEKTYTQDEAQSIIQGNIDRYMKELTESDKQITSHDITFDTLTHKVVADGIIVLIEKIGEKKYFEENERRQHYEEYFREDDPDST
ncbi:sporulation protein YqfD [Vallitalea pronyensis]|uniref:Sporulation protein YqfD n=1 Tax=Vallitalea pronyensis TaxID=1348613 RepID=A0A8J8SHK5_9FIRM|nr:sporulation protein YqfD [Vallitalea pronyensis]QUI23534.1 sporulation protein YqfD [Vallitalea pronyensis]